MKQLILLSITLITAAADANTLKSLNSCEALAVNAAQLIYRLNPKAAPVGTVVVHADPNNITNGANLVVTINGTESYLVLASFGTPSDGVTPLPHLRGCNKIDYVVSNRHVEMLSPLPVPFPPAGAPAPKSTATNSCEQLALDTVTELYQFGSHAAQIQSLTVTDDPTGMSNGAHYVVTVNGGEHYQVLAWGSGTGGCDTIGYVIPAIYTGTLEAFRSGSCAGLIGPQSPN